MQINSMVRSMINPMAGALIPISEISRNYTTFNPALSQYITIPEVTAAGDFELEVEFSTTDTANQMLLGDDHTVNFTIQLAGTDMNVYLSGTVHRFVLVDQLSSGKLHNAKIELVGAGLSVYVEGVQQDVTKTVVPFTGAVNIVVGNTNGYNEFFDGVIANVNFKSGWTQVGNATGNPFYKLDEDWVANLTAKNNNGADGNGTAVNITSGDAERFVEQGNGDWLGVERAVNGGFDSDTDWTKGTGWTISGGEAHYSDVATNNIYSSVNMLTVGLRYRAALRMTRQVTGGVRIFIGVGLNSPTLTVIQEHVLVGICAGNTTNYIQGQAGADFTIDDVSYKRILELA